jgi:hypothetical protein
MDGTIASMTPGQPTDDPFAALDEQLLLDLAGPASFERGVGYHHGGNVTDLDIVAHGTLQATIVGTHTYVARLSIDPAGRVDTACTCPVGADGLTCKHVVAAGLRLLAEQNRLDTHIAGGAERPTQRSVKRSTDAKRRTRRDPDQELADLLAGATRATLAKLIAERTDHDERWRDELIATLGATTADGPDPAHFKRLLQRAFRVNGFIEWRRAGVWAQHAQRAIAALDDLEPHAPDQVLRLCEYGFARCDKVYQRIDDSSGEITMLVSELERRHARAAAASDEDPVKLATRLLALLVDTDLGYCRTPFETHDAALGQVGRDAYRTLALAQLDELRDVDESAYDDESRELRSRKTGLRSALEQVARADRDVELLAEVIESRVSAGHHALRVAQACLEIDELDAAIEWAQRAAQLDEASWRSNPNEIQARALLARGHSGDLPAAAAQALAALQRSWQTGLLDLLLECADLLGERDTWRERALDAAAALDETQRAEVLAQLHLHIGEIDAAWDASTTGPCSLDLRARIADARASTHPEQSALVHLERVDEILARGANTKAYPRVEAALARADALLATPDGRAVFDAKMAELRDPSGHGRKTSLVKRLDKRGW